MSQESTIFVCSVENCTSVFKKLGRLNTHMLSHSDERQFVCPHENCIKSFKRADHLRRHQERSHNDVQDDRFVCTYDGCGKKLCSSTSLNRHIKRKHSHPSYKCSQCGIKLLQKTQLRNHEAQHSDPKPFKCDVKDCTAAFDIPSRLKSHQKQHKGYKCSNPGCDEIFYKWSLLCKHRRTEHLLAKTYSCDKCEKQFGSKFNLKTHQEVHRDFRITHHCPQEGCSRHYFDLKNLYVHLNTYHKDQSFMCSLEGCGRKFFYKTSLTRHMEAHKNLKVKKPRRKKQTPYKFVKRKSAAAILSGFEASKKDEDNILKADRIITQAKIQEQLAELKELGEKNLTVQEVTFAAQEVTFVAQEA